LLLQQPADINAAGKKEEKRDTDEETSVQCAVLTSEERLINLMI